MITIQSRSAVAPQAAARFATNLLLARCRLGAEPALMPQGRWLADNAQGLHDWLRAGGFHSGIEANYQAKTAAGGRCSLIPVGTDEE